MSLHNYAFQKCCTATIIDAETTRNTLRVDGPCVYCNKPQSVVVPAADLIAFGQGVHAQDCFPYLSAGQREFLISGICDKCWDAMFNEEDE